MTLSKTLGLGLGVTVNLSHNVAFSVMEVEECVASVKLDPACERAVKPLPASACGPAHAMTWRIAPKYLARVLAIVSALTMLLLCRIG